MVYAFGYFSAKGIPLDTRVQGQHLLKENDEVFGCGCQVSSSINHQKEAHWMVCSCRGDMHVQVVAGADRCLLVDGEPQSPGGRQRERDEGALGCAYMPRGWS